MLYEILVRATALLAEIESTPIAGTYFTAAEDVPEQVQDFEGYIAFMGNPAHTQDATTPMQFPNTVTFPGLLVGPQILTGNAFTNRTHLLQYADLIAAKFNERPFLENSTWQRLNGVKSCLFTGGRVIEAPFPQGQSQLIRRQYTWSLTIDYTYFVSTHD